MSLKFAVFAAAAFAMSTAHAQDAERMTLAIPAEVTEVITAGTWSDEGKSGVFRATVLTAPVKDSSQAHLVLQMMAISQDGNSSQIYKTVPVSQVSDKKLPNAFLTVEEDSTENEVTWRLTSYDAASDTDGGTLIKINAKGVIEVKAAAKDDDVEPAAKPEDAPAKTDEKK